MKFKDNDNYQEKKIVSLISQPDDGDYAKTNNITGQYHEKSKEELRKNKMKEIMGEIIMDKNKKKICRELLLLVSGDAIYIRCAILNDAASLDADFLRFL